MKEKLFIIIAVLSLSFNFNVTYAVSCGALTGENPSELLCPLYRLFNAAVLLAGLGIVVMIAIGAIKMGMSFGSPDKLSAANEVWKHALYGFLVVVGVVAIYTIVSSIFGITVFGSMDDIIAKFDSSFQELLSTYVIK
jgi:hypothetical protein